MAEGGYCSGLQWFAVVEKGRDNFAAVSNRIDSFAVVAKDSLQ